MVFTVAGIATSPSGRFDGIAFTPGSKDAANLFAAQNALDVAEFAIKDNMLTEEFREFCESYTTGASGEGISLIMDTSKLESIRSTLKLLEMLRPVALLAALLVGAFLCSLMIMQSSKEAAIMRILGTTKSKTRTMLASEQMLLGAAGLALGGCAMVAYKGLELKHVSTDMALFAALYFTVIVASAMICATLATSRSVLELLQTRE